MSSAGAAKIHLSVAAAYLARREVHEGPNVIGPWNGATERRAMTPAFDDPRSPATLHLATQMVGPGLPGAFGALPAPFVTRHDHHV
jgi:hypothetical protein